MFARSYRLAAACQQFVSGDPIRDLTSHFGTPYL